jgi:hypothetical protein
LEQELSAKPSANAKGYTQRVSTPNSKDQRTTRRSIGGKADSWPRSTDATKLYGQPTVGIKQNNPTPERKRKGVGLSG